MLDTLPRNVLGLIAFHSVLDEHGVGQQPSSLHSLLLASKGIHNALAFDEFPQLYYDLYCATFDPTALKRRFRWMAKVMAGAGKAKAKAVGPGQGQGQGPGSVKPGAGGKQMFNLFGDPRSWAIDYRTRWEMSKRMRRVVAGGRVHDDAVCDSEQLTGDLWNVWFLLTENDGRNLRFLMDKCAFNAWIQIYFKDELLRDSLVPGYPKETGEKALGIWCALLSGTDLPPDITSAEVDERIFVMRPYVFACAKYDVTYAPWHYRRLPADKPPPTPVPDPNTGENLNQPQSQPDPASQSKALPYKRFGYTWRRAAPHFILGAYLLFLRLLERQWQVQSQTQSQSQGQGQTTTNPTNTNTESIFASTPILLSPHHDREWQRNSVCQDLYSSPGLPISTFHGGIQGFWKGKFLFYDFDSYRQLLAGDIRGVYTCPFAQQLIEMELREVVVRVKKEEIGGVGPLLNAGFEDGSWENDDARFDAGFGHDVVDIEDEEDDEGWDKEILLVGKCRSAWGWARIRGRVRTWDGLVILALVYSPHVIGKWLWRGYLHPGDRLVGRWRDTFTPEQLRGYEGAFGMVRVAEPLWAPYGQQSEGTGGV